MPTIDLQPIKVEYPHGSGGIFLSSVLACCTKNIQWQAQPINFHTFPHQVERNHYFDTEDNVISIHDPAARYNFWTYYFKKRIVHELAHYRHGGQQWAQCPYETLDHRGNIFWVLNQCRFILRYNTQQVWQLNWTQMLKNPSASWKILQDFLDANNQPNYWDLAKWTDAVNDYQQTLPNKITVNPHHVKWQIWATAVLQEQEITPNFDLVDNFRTPMHINWLNEHYPRLSKYTHAHLVPIDH